MSADLDDPRRGSALDRPRPPLGVAPGSLSRRLGETALEWTFRLVQPGDPAPFALGKRPAEPRLYYTADDGWRAPLYLLAAPPGGGGQPLLLAHGLGGTWREFDLEIGHSLAHSLAAAGYAVYVMEHRGDRGASPPPGARPFSVDDIALRDLPAAIDTVRAHSNYDRVLFLGVGLGGAALLLHLALAGDPGVAAAVFVACSLDFQASSGLRAAGRVAALLPAGWRVPTRRLQQLLAPLCADGGRVGAPDVAGPVLRGRLRYGAGDLHAGVLRQLGRWLVAGTLTDHTGLIEVRAALQGRRLPPALVIAGDADPRCPAIGARDLAAVLGGESATVPACGALDMLLGERAAGEVHPTVLRFLARWRDACVAPVPCAELGARRSAS